MKNSSRRLARQVHSPVQAIQVIKYAPHFDEVLDNFPKRRAGFVRQLWFLVLLIVPVLRVCGGDFQNLGFEAATIVPVPGDPDPAHVQFGPAFPSWVGYYDSELATKATYNGLTLSAPNISIFSGGTNLPDFVLAGQYSAVLQASAGGVVTSLAQVGLVPQNAKFLQFKAQGPALELSLGGQIIPYSAIGTGRNYTLYAGDISAFAGQEVELRFSSHPVPFGANVDVIDSVNFSTVPEPSTTAILVMAGLFGGFCWRKKFSRR